MNSNAILRQIREMSNPKNTATINIFRETVKAKKFMSTSTPCVNRELAP